MSYMSIGIDVGTALQLICQGNHFASECNVEAAEKAYCDAIEIYKNVLVKCPGIEYEKELYRTYKKLGTLYHIAGNFDKAVHTYKEIIEMYPDITMGSLIEMFKKSIGIVQNSSAGNTNINDRDAQILMNLICGKYTKHEILSKGIVTAAHIDSIYEHFVDKLKTCRPVLSIFQPFYERLSQFYDGNTVFTSSVSQYANQNGLDEAWLVKLIKNVAEKVYEQNGISIKEKDFLVNAVENDNFASYSFAAESLRLRWIINRITKHYYQIEKDFLKKLNNKFWIHIPSLNTTAATEYEQYRDRVLFFREFKKYVDDKGFHIDRVFPNTKE